MVKLTRIYTRGGDKGKTSLGDGRRVSKQHRRIDAYGIVDEVNAIIGLVRLHLSGQPIGMDAMLGRIQNDLFDLGADLCVPESPEAHGRLRIVKEQVERLESEIDNMNSRLLPLNSFILPGGSQASAMLHLARTVARRAERSICYLASHEDVNPQVIAYINRLSDHFFVMSRVLNDNGQGDVLWVPGATRT